MVVLRPFLVLATVSVLAATIARISWASLPRLLAAEGLRGVLVLADQKVGRSNPAMPSASIPKYHKNKKVEESSYTEEDVRDDGKVLHQKSVAVVFVGQHNLASEWGSETSHTSWPRCCRWNFRISLSRNRNHCGKGPGGG